MQVLCMSGSNITHESVPMIIDICCHCPRLQQLDLGYSSIGTRGLRILSTGLLANPECKLRHLSLAGIGGVDDNMAQLLANSLVSNNKLKTLGLDRVSNSITSIGWERFLGILRHKTSINATSSSNHTLCSLKAFCSWPIDLPEDLLFCLQLNEEKNKKMLFERRSSITT